MRRSILLTILMVILAIGLAAGWYLTSYLPEKKEQDAKLALLNEQTELSQQLQACKQDKKATSEFCTVGMNNFETVLENIARLAAPKPDKHPYIKQLTNGYRLLADIAEAADDDHRSIRYYDKLRTWQPQSALWYAKLATLMSRQKDYRRATQYAHLATQLAPDIWQAHRSYARTLAEARHYERAIDAYKTTIDLAPYDEKGDIQKELNEFELRILSEAP